MDMGEALGFMQLNATNLTVLRLDPSGQAERLGFAPGMQLESLGGNQVRTVAEFGAVVATLVEDGVEECPLEFRDNRKNKAAAVVASDGDGLDAPPLHPKLAASTAAFVQRLFDKCPYLSRLNMSNNAGVAGVLILKKPAYKPGDQVEVDWRGRGQYWKATILRVNGPVQTFDVRYKIDNTLDQRLAPYRLRSYVKQRPDDIRPPAKY